MRITHKATRNSELWDDYLSMADMTTLCHEFGHALGLLHNGRSGKSCVARNSTRITPGPYDVGSLKLLYLLDHFPDKQFDPANTASYNAAIVHDVERTRDFTILHYCTSRRDDSPFWQQNTQRELPDTVRHRLDLYRASGRIVQQRAEPFTDLDWFYVLEGAGIVPQDYDPLVDTVDFEQVKRLMMAISQKISADVTAAPSHDSFFAAANARLAGARKAAAAAVSTG
jgi:hypothetical protein